MNFNHPKQLLFVLIVVLLIIFAATGIYLSRVHYTGDFYFKMITQKPHAENISFVALTPLHHEQHFYKVGEGLYNLSGYYQKIYIKSDTAIISQLTAEDSLYIKIGNNPYKISFDEIRKNWESTYDKATICYRLPVDLQKMNLLTKLNVMMAHTYFAPIAVAFYFVLLLIVAVFILLFEHSKWHVKSYLKILSINSIRLLSLLLIPVYFFVFYPFTTHNATVPLSGDSWEYQVMGVNLAKGHGVQRLSLLEPFDIYKFDKEDVDEESLHNLKSSPYYIVDTYRTPAYGFFLGLIYSIDGVNPLTVKLIQLLMLCFVAAFLPLLLYILWGTKGLLSGWAGGLIFLMLYSGTAYEIMTESLLIFISFLLLWVISSLHKKPSQFKAIITGFLLALGLLTKGMLIFVVLFYALYLILLCFRKSERTRMKHYLTVLSTFALALLPWSIYASSINHFLLLEPLTKKQIITATGAVDSLFRETVINSENIIEITSTINEIYHTNKYWDDSRYGFVNGFIEKHPQVIVNTWEQLIVFIKKEMNRSYHTHLQHPTLPWFNEQTLYINTSGLTLLTHQPRTLLLESNNEHCTDGGWHTEARHETYYYKNDNKKLPAFLRVLNFYMHHPKMILKIFPAKVHKGFKNFFFVQLFCLLVIFMNMFKNSRHIWVILLFIIPLFLILTRLFPSLLIIILTGALILTIFIYLKRKNPYYVNMPHIFNLFFLNTLLITLVFYGLDRFTLITEFLFIPLTLLVLGMKLKELTFYYQNRHH